jgi:hypothetical protein
MSWIFWLACRGESPESEPVKAESALDARAYRFCHTPGANAQDAQAWCDLLDDLPPERCPGLRATCAGEVTRDPVGCEPPGSGDGGDPDAIAGAPEAPPEPWDCGEMPRADGLQQLLRWVAALSVAVLVLVLLRLAWTTFGRARPPAPRKTELPPLVVSSDGTDVPDAPSGDLLDAARSALAEGRTSEAVLLARGAVLRKLGELGRIWLHRSRTDREYVRSVRSDAALHGDLRELCAAAETVRWQGAPIDHARAGQALAAAERLFGVLTVQRVGQGPTARMLWWLVLPALAWGLPVSDAEAQQEVWERYAPGGDAALLDVSRLYGYDAGFRLTNLSMVDERVDVLVIDTVHVQPVDEQWTHLRTWVEQGGVLLLGGDPGAFPELGETVHPEGQVELLKPWQLMGLPTPRWPNGPLSAFREGQGWALVADEEGNAIIEVLDLGLGAVVAIADPALLWNGAYVHPDNERFMGELLYAGQSAEGWPVGHPARVQLATRAAAAAPSESAQNQTNDMVGALASSGLLLFVIQLIATGTLVALWRGWPFAPLRDPPDPGRHAFVEHVRALGIRYWRLQATGHVEQKFAEFWLLRLGVPGLELAAQRAGYTAERARAWAREIEAIATPSEGGGRFPENGHERMEELWRITRGAAR